MLHRQWQRAQLPHRLDIGGDVSCSLFRRATSSLLQGLWQG